MSNYHLTPKELGQRLRRERKARGLTQEELSSKLGGAGSDQSNVSKAERGILPGLAIKALHLFGVESTKHTTYTTKAMSEKNGSLVERIHARFAEAAQTADSQLSGTDDIIADTVADTLAMIGQEIDDLKRGLRRSAPEPAVVKVKRVEGMPEFDIPSKEHLADAGADVRAAIEKPESIPVNGTRVISAGIRLEIPDGYEVQVRPRSGLAAKHSVTVGNSPGTIDSGYRGEVKVILANHGGREFTVEPGERIAQLVVSKLTPAEFELTTDDLSDSERSEGGFGSTGRS